MKLPIFLNRLSFDTFLMGHDKKSKKKAAKLAKKAKKEDKARRKEAKKARKRETLRDESIVLLCEEVRRMGDELKDVKSTVQQLSTAVGSLLAVQSLTGGRNVTLGPRPVPAVKTVWINARYKLSELTFHREIWTALGLKVVQSSTPPLDWTLRWSMRVQPNEWATGFEPWSKTNFIPGVQNLIRKDNLHRALSTMQQQFGHEEFDFWPQSYSLPAEWNAFAASGAARPNCPWILKPPAASCGRKIRVGASFEDLHVHAHSEWILNNRPVAQEYLETPLIDGHKFTLRVYCVLTGLDPLRVYVYRDGLCRIASRKFSTEKASFDDPLVHLDSIDINDKNSENVHFNVPTLATEGLRSTVTRVLEHLEKTEGANKEKLWDEICAVVVKSVLSAEKDMLLGVRTLVRNRSTCFDLLGYDILLDKKLKPFVIEINHSPSMAPLTDMENFVKRGMLSDYMKLADVALQDREKLRETVKKIASNRKSSKKTPYQVTDFADVEKEQSIDVDRLSDSDIYALANMHLESERRGQFQLVFPCKNMKEQYGKYYCKNRNVLMQVALENGSKLPDELKIPGD